MSEYDRDFFRVLSEVAPFVVVDLDISNNLGIVGSSNDIKGLGCVRTILARNTGIQAEFGGPLGLQIDAKQTHPSDTRSTCFNFHGLDGKLTFDI
jgi:hypothetical protein